MTYKGMSITTKPTVGNITRIIAKTTFNYMKVTNNSDTYSLYVSFDLAETWIELKAGESEEFENLDVSVVLLRSDGASQPVEIIYR